jgi:uncharacterized phiE125 gp8 family phage protein
MGLTQITPPTIEPVTRDEVKLQARISDPSQDARVDRFIASARAYAENRIGRQLLNATWRLTMDCFPGQWNSPWGQAVRALRSWRQYCDPRDFRLIMLPKPPLVSVTNVKYYDIAGTLQTLDPSQYVVDTFGEPGRLQLKAYTSWPVTQDRVSAVQIDFVAGYGARPDNVPADIKHAIETIAAHAYEHREAVVEMERGTQIVSVPLLADDLLDLRRVEMYLY